MTLRDGCKLLLALSVVLLLVVLTAKGEIDLGGYANRTTTDEEAIEIVRRAFEREPKLVADAIEAYKLQLEKQLNATIDEPLWRQVSALDEGVTRLGTLGAPVTMVMFTDPNCPYCRAALDRLLPMLAERDDVELRIREFPVLGLASRNLSEIAWAMNRQGLAASFYNDLALDQRAIDREQGLAIAQARGADMAQLERDATSAEARAALNANLELGRRLGVRGTPTFVIERKLIRGLLTEELFAQEFAAAARRRDGAGPTRPAPAGGVSPLPAAELR